MSGSVKNTKTGYGWAAIALHWLVALAVSGMFGLGLYMVELTYYDAWYKGFVAEAIETFTRRRAAGAVSEQAAIAVHRSRRAREE